MWASVFASDRVLGNVDMTNGATDDDGGNLPVAQPFNPGLVARDNDPDRNIVFGSLVTGDSDIVGLVAYSIYKQNKHDWLVAFEKARGREPKDDELQSYIIGESTARRLATYRHLAQSTLDGNAPSVTRPPRHPAASTPPSGPRPMLSRR
jgi:hypothetical protein